MGTVAGSRKKKARRRFSPLVVVLVVALVGVVGTAGVVGWQFIGTNILANRDTGAELAAVKASFAEAPALEEGATAVEQPATHEAAWVLRIPSLELEVPIIAGVEPGDLNRGVGWYPGSALPGQVGNFAVAGYRFSNGEPFRRLLELKIGDQVVVETAHAVFTYTVISAPGDLTVDRDDSWVLDPVPGRPEEAPTQAHLTLTTAEDVIDTDDRSVGFATLTDTENR